MGDSSFTTKIAKVKIALTNFIDGKIATHDSKTGSSQQKGHVQASSQAGLKDVSGGAAGTDNGVYARADHQHVLSDAYATANHTHSSYENPTIDNALSSTSTNAVQNKVVNTALGTKVDKETGKGLSTNDYTTAEKNKLAGIATEANKTTVDSSMSSSSTNPVQNKVVNSAIATKTVTVEKQATAETGYTATYVVKQNGTQVGEKINIPKDFLVKSASVNTVGASGAQTASQLGTGYSTGDKYIDFVINTKDNSGTDEHIYVNVKDLVDTYTAATTSTDGLMTAADKTKLNGIATGATKNTVEDSLSSTSTTNALSAKQGKELKTQIDNIVSGTTATNHNHDNRYYTESEIDTKLNGKAASSHTHPDTQINWNGSALANEVSPIDMAMYEEFSANRLAYLPGGNITVEYSTNGGSTWTDYGADATEKMKLVTTLTSFTAGKGATASANNQLRITIKAGNSNAASNVYLNTRKLMIYFSTGGGSGTKVKIEYSNYGTPTTWSTIGTYDIGGYSGWNSYPINLTYGAYNASQATGTRPQNIRLTFTTGSAHNFNVQKIRLFGENCWITPSTIANNGHIYTYDENRNATFYGKIIKNGGTSSQFLKANGDVDSNTYLTSVATGNIANGAVTNAKLADQTNTVTEYIVGTQTGSTSAWTGTSTKITSLAAGQVIYYKLPYASTNTAVTLNLTLANGTTTGAKEVWFWNGSRVTTNYGVNSIIGLIYNGSQWWVINPSNNNNNYYLVNGDYLTTGEALTTQNLIACKKADKKYYKINTLKNTIVDISRPILLANGSVNANTNTNNVAIYHPWVSPTHLNGETELTLSSTIYQPVYLEGTEYNNGEFTVSSTPITQTLTNGRFYIMLGVAYATNGMGVDLINQQVFHYENDRLVPISETRESGGTNLLLNSQNFGNVTNGALTGDSYKGCKVRRYNNTNGTTYLDCQWGSTPTVGEFVGGDTFTLSFWAKGTGSIICYSYGSSGYMQAKPIKASEGATYSAQFGDGNCSFTLTSDWKRYYVTWLLNPTSTATNVAKTLTIRALKGADAYYAGPMLERGEIAHDWSPAPNDKVDTTDSRLTNARTPTSHTHGSITNDGKIGSTASLPIITGTGGALQTGSFGTTAGTFCQGNDSRLSDARQPKITEITQSGTTVVDIDTYTTAGFYAGMWDGNAQYIIHTPRSNGTSTPYTNNKSFFMIVENLNGSTSYVKQTLTYYDNAQTYVRTKKGASAGWTSWIEVTKDTNTTYTGSDGITLSGTTFKHTNTGLTAQTTSALKKIKYDAQGHITGTDTVAAADLPSHTHSYISTSAGSVGASNLASNAVETAKIKDANVTRSKLGSDIIISGANLLTGTQAFSSPAPSGSSLSGTYYGCNARYVKNTSSSYIDFSWNIPQEQLEPNAYYTFSFWAKSTTAHNKVVTYLYNGNNQTTLRETSNSTVSGNTSATTSVSDGGTYFGMTTSWKRHYVVYKLHSTAISANKTLAIRLLADTSVKPDIYVAGVKFEKGSIPTEWNAHPNDKANASHTHGQISNDGKITTTTDTVGNVVVTDGSNIVKVKNKIPFANLDISKANITGLGIPGSDTNTTYTAASATPLVESYSGTVGTSAKYAREDHAHPHFDFRGMKGTDNTAGYVKCLQLKPTAAYQDKPIAIEIFQRDRTEKTVVQIKYNNANNADPTLQSITHTGQNIGVYLYKSTTSTWELICSKGHSEKYGEMVVKIDNPNNGITITSLDTHIASLPTSNITTSTYIGFTSAEKTKLAGIATNANNYSHPSTHAASMITGLSTVATSGSYKDLSNKPSYTATVNTSTSGYYEIGKINLDGTNNVSIYGKDTNTTYSGATGTSALGLVKISDNYTSSAGNASQSVAASSKAVYDTYNTFAGTGTTKNAHTHTKSQITDFPTTMTPTDGTVTNAKVASNAAIAMSKINVPNYTKIDEQTVNGLTVKIYSDGYMVYAYFTGDSVTGLTANGSKDVFTLKNTLLPYSPPFMMYSRCRPSVRNDTLRITSAGVVTIWNDNNGTTLTSISCGFSYPKKSRFP